MIEIDGSYGEGGGQILRTALSLSCLFETPFRIVNIRRNRKKPGLMPQHLTGVRAARLISGATVTGDHPGSTELVFVPGAVKGGDYVFDVGTAGSTLLILQALLPPLFFARERSTVALSGGTHVPWSPSFHYVSGVFAPMLLRLGMEIRLFIDSYGFYPRGGGKIRAEIHPADRVKPLRLTERGKPLAITGCSGAGRLPLSIAERQRKAAEARIRSVPEELRVPVRIDLLDAPSPGPGTFLFLRSDSENSLAGFMSLGAPGKRAETVGEEAAEEFLRHVSTDAALDPYLPDQIVPYLSLCEEVSVFSTSRITRHLLTNLWVMSLFRPFAYSVEGETGSPGRVRIH